MELEGSFVAGDHEATMSNSGSKQDKWITFPFIIGATAGSTLAVGGMLANLIVYLVKEFNVKSIDAAQISNVVNGCISLFPIVGAIVSDSFLGSFPVIVISSCVSLLGTLLVALTAMLDSLRPQPCELGSSLCQAPSKVQFAVLYGAMALVTLGFGGIRFTMATMGANQFDEPKNQGVFFNWYFFTWYTSAVISATAIVYIQDNVSWALGFGLCLAANFIGVAIFLLGNRYYRYNKPHGSPFTGLARVVIATIQKRKVVLTSSRSEDYYHGTDGITKEAAATASKSLRFLNRAALKTEGDIKPDGSIARPWRLCTLQQVEDFKTVVKMFPLWSSSIFLGTPIGIQASLTVLQALTLDRHLGQHFQIPAGSMSVVVLISTSIFLTLLDRCLCSWWQKITRQSLTPLQLIGAGHVLNVLSMAVSALVESRRLKIAHAQQHHQGRLTSSAVPMSALWLFPQLALAGIGEAFHFPGQVSFYYREFPVSLRTTATAMISLIVAIAFYLSTALIDLARRVTDWLPDDINKGRLDNMYWMLVAAGMLNFGYYLCCAKVYNYRNFEGGTGGAA